MAYFLLERWSVSYSRIYFRPTDRTAIPSEHVQGDPIMSQPNEQRRLVAIAVYPDRESVEHVLRRLHEDGFALQDLSIIGRGPATTDMPAGVVTTGDLAVAGAEVGAVTGGLFGLLLGTVFLIVPTLGPVLVAGSLSAALAGAAEGAAVGAVIGGLSGALVGWGIPAAHVRRYETHINEGRFLVLARGDTTRIEHVKSVLALEAPDQLEVYETSA
jgi:uncharacterized membrane protein